MPAERAGYTVTMFCIDVSSSMGRLRSASVSDSQGSESPGVEMTNLAWALQYVLLKVQEMIFNGRKTDQCGVILFGTEETSNVINESSGGYDHVSEFIPIAQPNAGTLAKLQSLQPSTEIGDPVDAIIVAIETQDRYLAKKKSWTRKLVLLTDGENPIELEDWELTVKKINDLQIFTTIIGIDFADEEPDAKEEDKSIVKLENEKFFHRFISELKDDLGMIGSADFAIQDCQRPRLKETKSVLMGITLRLGDVEVRPDEAIELPVKMSKCTAAVRPPSLKKFAKRVLSETGEGPATQESHADGDEDRKDVYVQLSMQTEYVVQAKNEDEEKPKEDDKETIAEKVDKDQLIKGFKYGASYVPCPDGQFPRLSTRKGMDICAFFPDHQIRRELAMGEVQYVWADPSSGESQVAFSSIVQAMLARKVVAIARWVSRDEMDPKMGLLIPRQLEKVDCFLWMQMPFADDVRKYTFPSLDNLISKKGERITKHPFIPTEEQMEAMDRFVDDMDLMQAGEKDESGDRLPWFDPRYSYNPAVHRIKQALFHAAVVTDLRTNPLPPPHEEVVKYLKPPRRVLKRAQPALEECKEVFKVKQVPKRVVRARKDGHVKAAAADDDEDELLILDQPKPLGLTSSNLNPVHLQVGEEPGHDDSANSKVKSESKEKSDKMDVDESGTESESDGEGHEKATTAREDAAKDNHDVKQLPSPEPSIANENNFDDLDVAGRQPGHIIGTAHPLDDFKKSIEDSSLVNRAIEELVGVLNDILSKPFARRRHAEIVACMHEMRDTCVKRGHVDTWNSFLMDLKANCLSSTKINNVPFWEEVRHAGARLTLIGKSEAKEASAGSSNVSDEEAQTFLRA